MREQTLSGKEERGERWRLCSVAAAPALVLVQGLWRRWVLAAALTCPAAAHPLTSTLAVASAPYLVLLDDV